MGEKFEKEPALDKRLAFEEWSALKHVDEWKVRAAKALRGWPIGAEVSETEFNQAVYDACNHVMR